MTQQNFTSWTSGQGQSFQPSAASVQTIVTNLQNLVLAVNALTTALTTQFGSTGIYTVANLPSPNSQSRAFVSDSTVAASGNFGSAVTGGGSHTVPVFFDNSGWKIG